MTRQTIENNIAKNDNSAPKDLLAQHKRELEVILIYPKPLGFDNRPPYAHFILKYGLDKLGIPNTLCEESSEECRKALTQDNGKYKIAARSMYFESIPTIEKWARRRNLFPEIWENIFTVVGGQATTDKDARTYMLQHGVDAICKGHAGPFQRFMGRLQQLPTINKELVLAAAKDLLATLEQPNVPLGEFLEFDIFPLVACWTPEETTAEEGQPKAPVEEGPSKTTEGKKVNHVIIPHYWNCRNGCDYCNIIKMPPNNVADSIVNTIRVTGKPIPKLIFSGPNFEKELQDSYRKIIHATKEVQGYTPETNQIMDPKQLRQSNYDTTMKLIHEFNVRKAVIGLDVIDGETAAAVGRCDNRRIRTGAELEDEKTGLLRFLKDSEIREFEIFMLLTPFDTPETIQKILTYYEQILLLEREKNLDVHITFSPLLPYPGTRLYHRYRDNIEINDYGQFTGKSIKDLSLWKFNKKMFGLDFMKLYEPTHMEAHMYGKQELQKQHYLNFLSLHMMNQYLLGKKDFGQLQIPEYGNDPLVKAMFDAMKKTAMEGGI